ncbi:MAG: hypothetical protein A2Z16_08235 [Chloroflexi bacterium RBG_16_54_18]|nr:MAG: hypothetical protein A2Z16_08235 [Chloroflexi bacterium RBG_16_54_18]
MRFTLVTSGSWGDTAPFLALGLRLQAAGHKVLVTGSECFSQTASNLGIEYRPLPDEEQSSQARAAHFSRAEEGGGIRSGLRRLESKRKIFDLVNREVYLSCQDADAIVYRIGGYLIADSIAEKLSVPCFKVGLVPYTRTREFPTLYVYPSDSSGRLRNLFSHVLGEQVIWQSLRVPTNSFRKKLLALEPYPVLGAGHRHWTQKLPVLYAFSPSLLRRPDDWPENVHITGHWETPTINSWNPSPELERFIESGLPPVYIGFGSMAVRDVNRIYGLILRALEICDQRAVICGDLCHAEERPAERGRVLRDEYIPHDWLFPLMSCIVHHGGIGTTTVQMKAGVPAVIVPFNFDQPFWGAILSRSGMAPDPIPFSQLTAERLAQAIHTCLDSEEMRQMAAGIANQVRKERGIERSIEIMHTYMEEFLKK